jgi:hypothetical protein
LSLPIEIRRVIRWHLDARPARKDQILVCVTCGPFFSYRPFLFVGARWCPLLPGEDLFPILLHGDDEPAILFCLTVQRLGKGANFGVGQPLRLAVDVLELVIVVQHKHGELRVVNLK